MVFRSAPLGVVQGVCPEKGGILSRVIGGEAPDSPQPVHASVNLVAERTHNLTIDKHIRLEGSEIHQQNLNRIVPTIDQVAQAEGHRRDLSAKKIGVHGGAADVVVSSQIVV